MAPSTTLRTVRTRGSVAMAVLVLALAGCTSSASSTASSSTPSGTASTPGPSVSSPSPSVSASTPSVSPSTSPSVTPAPAPTPTPTVGPTTPATVTSVVITVQGCPKGCRIFAEQDGTATLPLASPWQVSALVTNGRVTLKIPVGKTRGLHFAVSCPGDVCNSSNAQPVVVMRYRGIAVGATVTDAVAKTQAQASPCWAGTLSSRASFALHVTVFPDRIFTRDAHSIRAWMSPQAEVVTSTWYDTYRGGLGTQDVVLC